MNTGNRTRVALDCLGCKLNQAEMEALSRELTEAGYEVVPPEANPDVYILNTCTVTGIADSKSRHLLRMAHRRSPNARLVAVGCYAERASRELSIIEGVELVLGNGPKADLLHELEASGLLSRRASCAPTDCHPNGSRTRSFIKIQDGCRNFCTYCIVPMVRSEEKSVPADEVMTAIDKALASGNQEIVLTGTKVGSYRDHETDLPGLLKLILADTSVTRLRLSSVQPQELSPELIGLWRDSRLCPHFHLSLQSGSDSILQQMNRRYSTPKYREAIGLIRKMVPGAAITTDVIAGFPGESDAQFEESFNFCREMQFARIHVFPYSPRRGTEAAGMPQVDSQVKKERSRRMLALADESALSFRQQFLGRTNQVLWEKQSDGIWSGLTGNYTRVYARSEDNLENRLLPVKLAKIYGDGVWGELQKEAEHGACASGGERAGTAGSKGSIPEN
ncbi:MAG: tRNA (N(6)-L-threonylcarbamoyladenosine(37)-C(2))-methylthiotransferase MtaB [Dehalococcoidales bacterium]|nr:tRNA (N(6)-L-threonylcarbamoyladenosine(37)-C(2))-methylthiotransferase MtaB [Dehalococcoidales bacterium]